MASLYLLIPIAVIFVVVALALFFWAVDASQFDDPDGAAHSILFDEPPPPQPEQPLIKQEQEKSL